MKNKVFIKLLPLMLTLNASGQTAAERLELGVQLQTTEQNYDAAIAEYKEVLKSAARSERLAAEARFRLAECFSAKGNDARAKEHLKQLQESFSPDNKWVKKSQELLPPHQFLAKPWKGDWICRYEVKKNDGTTVGQFVTGERLHGNVLEYLDVRTGGGRGISRAHFKIDSFAPISVQSWGMAQGAMSLEFSEYQKTSLLVKQEGKEFRQVKSADGRFLFENQQMVQVLRGLNQELGTTQKTSVISSHFVNASGIDFDVKVDSYETVSTDAGSFDCAKITTNLNQTFYISRDESRQLVKLEIGAIPIELVSREKWDYAKESSYSLGELGASLQIPGFMIYSDGRSTETVHEARFWAADMVGHEYVIDARKLEKAAESPRSYAEALHEKIRGKGIFTEFKVVDGTWEDLNIAGFPAAAVKLIGKVGEVQNYEYHLVVMKEDLALSFYVDYALQDEEEAIKRLLEMAQSLKF